MRHWSIAEVRAITEEAIAVRAVERLTLAPRTVSQVSVIVSALNAKGTVMVEAGPGPLGLCPVRGVAEVDRDTKIWLVNLGSLPVEIEGEQVVTMAESVSETAGTDTGTTEAGTDEVNGKGRSAPHRCGAPAVGGGSALPPAPVRV